MLYRVVGKSGSGKTEYMLGVIGLSVEMGGDCVVIVPEQQSVDYEMAVFSRYGGKANMNVEVLNFERLPNRTYREYGGLAGEYIDKGGRGILMYAALEQVNDSLTYYRDAYRKPDFIRKALAQITAFKYSEITPQGLLSVAPSNNRTIEKLRDMSLIYKSYCSLFNEEAHDIGDALSEYADNLEKMDFFRGKTVIIDSFYTFTAQELRIIKAIIRQSENVYVSFISCGEDDRLPGIIKPTFDMLGKLPGTQTVFLEAFHRNSSEAALCLQNRLWQGSGVSDIKDDGFIKLISALSVYDECLAAAKAVRESVKSGMRFSDIAIVYRGDSEYADICRPVLEKNGIPVYSSSKQTADDTPLYALIMSIFDLSPDNMPIHSVKKYIRSGFSGLNLHDCDLLIRYVERWNIQGAHWSHEWDMSPSGYLSQISPHDVFMLERINAAREKIYNDIQFSGRLFNEKMTADQAAKHILSLLLRLNVNKKLLSTATKLRKSGNEEEAQRVMQQWEVCMTMLEQLAQTIPQYSAEIPFLKAVFELMCSEYSMGAIPASADSVTLGDASMLRAGNSKVTVMLGVNDGIFPAVPSSDSVFTDAELVELENLGLAFSDTEKAKTEYEKLFFLMAAVSPSKQLYIIYNDTSPSRPSVAVMRIKKLFPFLEAHKFGSTQEDYLFSPSAASENITKIKALSALKQLSDRGLDLRKRLEEHPITNTKAVLETSGTLPMTLSPSRLEKYTYCGFAYFCNYILKLDDNKTADFSSAEIGTFIHHVLEEYLKSNMQNGKFSEAHPENRGEEIKRIAGAYISALKGLKSEGTERLEYIVGRLTETLEKLVANLCEELSGSGYQPVAFEEMLGGNVVNTAKFTLHDRSVLSLSGIIDRIDIMKKDGKTYVRVVDYKSGRKKFDYRAVENGLDLQMLIYLFAACDSIENSVPGGVLYFPATVGLIKTAVPLTPEDYEKENRKRFGRTGILLDDIESVKAMDPEFTGAFAPARLKKDMTFYSNSSVISAQALNELKKALDGYIVRVAEKLKSGVVDINPLKLDGGHNACLFCALQPVCRASASRDCVRYENKEMTLGDKHD